MRIKTLAAAAALWTLSALTPAHAAEIKIGSVFGLTGPTASTAGEGMAIANGYLDMINAKGGINGNTLKLAVRDDQYDPRKTPALVEELITKENIVALVNGLGTANTAALMKTGVLTQHRVPMIGVFSGSDIIRGPGSEQIFHTRASYTDEVMKISRLASTLGLKRVAVLFQEDGFGASINQAVSKASETYGFEIVQKVPYKPGETDFTQHAKQITDARPQAIFLMGVPEAVTRFMKVYDKSKSMAQVYALSFVPAKQLADAAGEMRVRGVGISQVVPNPSSTTLPLAKEFQSFLKSPYGKGVSSNPLNFEVFLNLRLAVEAIRMAGPKPTPEKVTHALTTMNSFMLAGYPINFSETNRRGAHYLDIAVVGANGRLHY
ncbi:ABC transporter substrate-binding protein [Noviherbaspirillum sp.]|uniref:ABC transporter substrate-binding protein n=1 Tax=Noviherbaspirillum sp. TaxID=1926288 RepID=UPI002D2706EA|nr:ABC transporter substrate-binding protein [Noviherbaspirillum sp.]HZW21130.1 ABC transporter substrate-binding protein [Noviherbaspirillum sp.]